MPKVDYYYSTLINYIFKIRHPSVIRYLAV